VIDLSDGIKHLLCSPDPNMRVYRRSPGAASLHCRRRISTFSVGSPAWGAYEGA
jgi:hypothetical protein